jgi:hypothetical protein
MRRRKGKGSGEFQEVIDWNGKTGAGFDENLKKKIYLHKWESDEQWHSVKGPIEKNSG